jgi:hypothetical protein
MPRGILAGPRLPHEIPRFQFGVRRQSPPLSYSRGYALRDPNRKAEAIASALHSYSDILRSSAASSYRTCTSKRVWFGIARSPSSARVT